MWWAKSVTQPSPDVSMSEYQLINHKIKYPGIVTWNDIDITMVEPNKDSKVGFKLFNELKGSGYYTDPTNGATDGLKKNVFSGEDILITKIDADGELVETWKLINPFIKAIKYGDLDYSSDDLLEIIITVAYDSATLT
tara:strand:+ start:104 stop:517 length:414 start_codon:yes stop_codon:yes gene_type:complete